MPIHLSSEEVRVLSVLIEKELTTPEYYPMTVNALTNACNQKTNRDPVTHYSDTEVLRAFDHLRKLEFARLVEESGSRANKCRHRFVEMLHLTPPQTAVLTELMLRGAQTLGELRTRAERMYKFSSLEEVESTLLELISPEHFAAHTYGKPLVMRLPRQAGQKEARFTHLLSGEPDLSVITPQTSYEATSTPSLPSIDAGRLQALEEEVASLREEIRTLQENFATFKQQFE
jgi:hypothetical protein